MPRTTFHSPNLSLLAPLSASLLATAGLAACDDTPDASVEFAEAQVDFPDRAADLDARLVDAGPPEHIPGAGDTVPETSLQTEPTTPPRQGHVWVRVDGNPVEVPYFIEDGVVLMSDDEGIGTVDQVFGHNFDTALLGISDLGARWDDGVVFFEIASGQGGFEPAAANQIRTVLDDLQANTPLTFVETDSGSRVRFEPWANDNRGRSSTVGMLGNGQVQNIWVPGRPVGCQPSANEDCDFDGNRGRSNSLIAHEMLHAAGVRHEAQRPDRNQFVTYHEECVVPPTPQNDFTTNFEIKFDAAPLGPYDEMSIMHYSGGAFCNAITAIDGTVSCVDDCFPLTDNSDGSPSRPLWVDCGPTSMSSCWLTDYDVQGLHTLYGDFGDETEAGSWDYNSWALAAGDFNGDGYDDLASASVLGGGDAGEVLIYAGVHGVATAPWSKTQPGLVPWQVVRQEGLGVSEAWDLFGWSLVAADFDDDGFDDLAVGATGEDDTGAVFVYRGGRAGLEPWQKLTVTNTFSGISQSGAQFGAALTAVDVDQDGKPELVVGAPNDRLNANAVRCGGVYVLELSGDAFVFRNRFVPSGSACQAGADVGTSLSAGTVMDYDQTPEIAIGAPGHDSNRGRVYLVEVDDDPFLGADRVVDQASSTSCGLGVFVGTDPRESGDRFGEAVVIGRRTVFERVLVVGSPGEDGDNGRVDTFGYADGCFKHEGSFQEEGLGANESGDRFGAALAIAPLDDDSQGDLLVGAPGEGVGANQVRAGWVYAYRGMNMSWTPWTSFGQSSGGWTNESSENFGAAFATGSFDAGARELVVAAPRAHHSGLSYAGASFLFRANDTAKPMGWRQLDANGKSPLAK